MRVVAAEVVLGYEYHDDYIETSRVSVTITDEDSIWKLGIAEDLLLDIFLRELYDEDDRGWMRIESLERITF